MGNSTEQHTFYVKVSSVVSMSNYLIVTGDKPWVSHQGNLSIGNDPTPVVIPAQNWAVVYAVDPTTRMPINVVVPRKADLPEWTTY